LFTFPERVLDNPTDNRWADKHAISWLTIKVPLALYCAIVLSSGFVQFKAYPLSGRKVGGADEAYSRLPAIGQFDHRAGRYALPRHCAEISKDTMIPLEQ
jgi:hypothetical protein